MTIQTTIEPGNFSVYHNGEYIGDIQATSDGWLGWNKINGLRGYFDSMEAAKSVFREKEKLEHKPEASEQTKLF